MVRGTHIGYALILVGVGIGLLSFGFGGATARACPQINSVVYATIGVHPTGVAITGVDIGSGSIQWYDGCNWRTNSFVPLVVGGLVSTAGVLTLRVMTSRNSETGT